MTRGIDFKGVANVVNFDFPPNAKNYVHRAGRTARGGASGNVLSLLKSYDQEVFDQVQVLLAGKKFFYYYFILFIFILF